ncbi:MAG: hypothetical protein EB071_05340, partial [Gammaproteobacteria bacterium]|nr:hypothetical protein [Gammaproteobacteria bacterium]
QDNVNNVKDHKQSDTPRKGFSIELHHIPLIVDFVIRGRFALRRSSSEKFNTMKQTALRRQIKSTKGILREYGKRPPRGPLAAA